MIFVVDRQGGSELGKILYGHQGLKKGILIPTSKLGNLPLRYYSLALTFGGGGGLRETKEMEGMRDEPLPDHHVKSVISVQLNYS